MSELNSVKLLKSSVKEAGEYCRALLAELSFYLLRFGVAKFSFTTFKKIMGFVFITKGMKKFQSKLSNSKSNNQTSFDKNLYYDDFY